MVVGRSVCHFSLIYLTDNMHFYFFTKGIYKDMNLNCVFTHKMAAFHVTNWHLFIFNHIFEGFIMY